MTKLVGFIIIIQFSLSMNCLISAQGYEIPVKVNNLADSMIYLGHHFGSAYFINDSARLDKNGETVFKGTTKLKSGIYFIFLPKSRYFDFLVDKHQYFSIIADTSNFIFTVKFKNSYQNTKFYAYQKYLNQVQKQINARRELQKNYLSQLDTLMMIEQDIQMFQNKIYLQNEEIIAQHPDSLISVLVKSAMPIVPPPAPKDSSGALLDSAFEYKYIKQHFFDNINFADERLLYSSVIQNKVLDYLTSMIVPHYDTICREVDYVVAKTEVNPEVHKFVLNTLFQYYLRSNIITDENVFVYIAENYFISGKASWATDELKSKLKTDVDARKLNLVGQVAPDFQMKDDKGKPLGLRTIKKSYIIIYFYDVDCEICQQVTPEMMNFYRIIKDRDIEVIGIYTGKDNVKWKKYIEEKHLIWKNVWDPDNKSGFREKYSIAGTPVIYLLDENQKILAKKITVEQLMGYFNSVQ
ncbi:MAG: redoxin domain-containing protein [Bacteroidales bacterium]